MLYRTSLNLFISNQLLCNNDQKHFLHEIETEEGGEEETDNSSDDDLAEGENDGNET